MSEAFHDGRRLDQFHDGAHEQQPHRQRAHNITSPERFLRNRISLSDGLHNFFRSVDRVSYACSFLCCL
jgi:hypothetical protein